MIVSLYTCTPQFANDIADMIRVFYGSITLLQDQPGGDLTFVHTEAVEGAIRTCEVVCGTARTVYTEALMNDPLEEKRLHKRQIKRAVFDVLKEITGQVPPWGSLTGIRPTRLVYAAMDKEKTLEEALQTVRDTFEVSEPKLRLLRDIVTVQRGIPLPQADEVDIYIGIPFCTTRCAYCTFLSGEVGNGNQLAPYVEALTREMALTQQLMLDKGLRVRALYVGGGTPTSLPWELLKQVMDAARPWLQAAEEITVEAGRPDTITFEKLQVLRDAGTTRISINPQTMHDETLRLIGRGHTRQQTEDAYRLARSLGFSHINMDLIAGLPGETLAMFEQTLLWSGGLSPESLTVHSLALKRTSLLSTLPDSGLAAQMVGQGEQAARGRGMLPYYLYRQKFMAGNLENVGYALPGHACRYNIDMMEETAHILAVGAGAISKRVYPAQGKILRAPNVSEITHYLQRVDEMAARKAAIWEE